MATQVAIAIALVFVATAVLTGSLVWLATARMAPARKRLQAMATGSPQGSLVLAELSVADTDEDRIRRLSKYVPRSPKDMSRLRRRLARAGYQGVGPALLYSVAEIALPILVAAIMLPIFGMRALALFFTAAGMFVAYMLPGLILERLIAKRQRQIQNGLPDAVDLLIVCVEAGSSLDQAVVKASEELQISYPALAEELRYVTTEVRAGKSRIEAFKNFAERTKVDDARALVAMMVQTDRFGTSIAQALRTFADATRTKRRQAAEEKAAKLGVKLLFPLVFFLFPSMYVVLLGPAMIRILRVFLQQNP